MPSEVGIQAPTVFNLDIILFSPGWKLAQPSPCRSFWYPELAEAALTVRVLCVSPVPFMILRGSACRVQTGARRVGSAVAGCEGPGDRERLHLELAAGGTCHRPRRS